MSKFKVVNPDAPEEIDFYQDIPLVDPDTGADQLDSEGNILVKRYVNHTVSIKGITEVKNALPAIVDLQTSTSEMALDLETLTNKINGIHSYLPLTGGTITGNLIIEEGTITGSLTGVASNATADVNNKELTSYIADIMGANAQLSIIKGDGTTSELSINNVPKATNADNLGGYPASDYIRSVNGVNADENGNVKISSLIPNQIIQSPVPLTDANLHLLDGALLSGSGAYSAYVAMMGSLHDADPTATCWTTESDWQTSVTTYGECGKFVFDSVNNTLRLPKLKSFIQATTAANELGSLVEAGAPNITGDVTVGRSGLAWQVENVYGGALYNGHSHTGIFEEVSRVAPASSLAFDASRSNPIYGKSNTVQPQAIKYYFYIVIGTVVSKTDIQINIDNVMTDLDGKADKDLSNVTAPTQAFKDMVTSWITPDYSSGIRVGPLSSGQAWKAPANGILINVVKSPAGGAFLSHTKVNNDIKSNDIADNWIIYNDTFVNSDDYQTATAIVGKGETFYQTTTPIDRKYEITMFYPFK